MAGTSQKKKKRFKLAIRFLVLAGTLALTAGTYFTARHLVFRSMLMSTAQRMLNQLLTARVEKVGRLTVDVDGSIVLTDLEISATRDGVTRPFYRAKRAVLALDGWPLRDRDLRLARVDLFDVEIFVRRDGKGAWNLTWILQKPPEEPRPAPPPPPPAPQPPTLPPAATTSPEIVAAPPRDGFPFNGIHLHRGRMHVTIEGRSGREFTWTVTDVEAQIAKTPELHIGPIRGNFYGGRFHADAVITSLRPFGINATVKVLRADVAKLAAGTLHLRKPVSGSLDGVVSLRSNAGTSHRPIASGQIEITEGNLYELPAFTGILALLALEPFEDRIVRSAQIMFTVETGKVRIDQMNFLGNPVSLFGDGVMTLSGDEMRVVLIPRLTRSYDDILSVIGAPIKLLADVALGALVPMEITGPFWGPKIQESRDEVIAPAIRKLIEEAPPPPK